MASSCLVYFIDPKTLSEFCLSLRLLSAFCISSSFDEFRVNAKRVKKTVRKFNVNLFGIVTNVSENREFERQGVDKTAENALDGTV